LLTTTANPNLANFGQLGNPQTTILVDKGPNTFDYGYMPGLLFGMMISPGILPPIEISGFTFSNTVTAFSGGSLTNPTQLLAIPVQDIQPAAIIPGSGGVGTETAIVLELPIGSAVGALGGTVSITSHMDLWGIEAITLLPLGCSDVLKLDVVLGYRHLQLNELIQISTVTGGQVGNVIFQNVQLPQGLFQVSSVDNFKTTNVFDGAQLGARGVLTAGRMSLYGEGKIGLGVSTSTLTINGSSTLTYLLDASQSTTVNGGILALGTNSGRNAITNFNVTAEGSAALSYQVSANLRAFAGYSFLWWGLVARPGQFISHQVDTRQIPAGVIGPGPFAGPTLPTTITPQSFFASGLFLGVEIGF
jgi:hypothetical protein